MACEDEGTHDTEEMMRAAGAAFFIINSPLRTSRQEEDSAMNEHLSQDG